MANVRIVVDSCPHTNIYPITCVCNHCGIIVGNNYRFVGPQNSDYDDTRHASRKTSSESTLFDPNAYLHFSFY